MPYTKDNHPNIMYIFTDQQSANMMSCTGNKYLKTPGMDSLAETGIRFDKAYCSNPVCLPSRFSMMTGFMPSKLDIRSNDVGWIESVPDDILNQSMGWLLRNAGYDTGYGGKVHLPRGMTPETMGFERITPDQRAGLADSCVEFIQRDRDKPFFLLASFINPHDICYMAIRAYQDLNWERLTNELGALNKALEIPEGISEDEFFDKHCPPLPDNFKPQLNEPEAISMVLDQRKFKRNARENWTEEMWRMHRWAYCRLTEMVDAHIVKVLDALRDSGQEENTLVIFSSDHGDMDSAHGMEHKTVLYEEPTRVPLIVSQKGTTPAGMIDNKHLVSNGLDLIPTLCDYAEINPPANLSGKSFKSLVEGKDVESWCKHLWIESEFGYMVCGERFKYMLYDEGDNREQLMDLEKDPGEMRNWAKDPKYGDILKEYRQHFQNYRSEFLANQ
ncbi:sulfatase-like hydrolase/transferase [Candidatus Poribacteria bacterium]|nr:sulfatase-like hydrolase/transferase [Candidatus Poribacteria bacterium]